MTLGLNTYNQDESLKLLSAESDVFVDDVKVVDKRVYSYRAGEVSVLAFVLDEITQLHCFLLFRTFLFRSPHLMANIPQHSTFWKRRVIPSSKMRGTDLKCPKRTGRAAGACDSVLILGRGGGIINCTATAARRGMYAAKQSGGE